jgi:hypothetical protein
MTETKHANIAAALIAAQKAMGKALKQSNNPHFRSKYADLGNVMDACLPALNENGIAVFQPSGEDEHGRYIATVLMHESGEKLECKVPLIVSKNDMQGYGSAVTYARRYGLMSMAGIAPEDDDGNAAAAAPPAPRQKKPAQSAPKTEEPRDPQKISAWLIDAIGKATAAEALGAWPAEGSKAEAAWAWLALEAPDHNERVKQAYAKRREELTEAPF